MGSLRDRWQDIDDAEREARDQRTSRARLERTARIVAGGTCPHAKTFGAMPAVYCDREVDPTTGEHARGYYHRGQTPHPLGFAGDVLWEDDDVGAFVE